MQKEKSELYFTPTNKESDMGEKAMTISSSPDANRLNAVDTATAYRS